MSLPPLPANDEEFSVESRNTSPANLLMKIESFSLLSKYGISEYESREFEAGGHKWKMIIYLEGEHVCVCLSASGTKSLPMDWEINVIFTFLVYNHFSNNYLCFRGNSRRFNTVNPKWRFSKLISKKKLTDPSNGYLVDDNCVFGAEVFVIKGDQRVNECLCLLKETAPVKRDWQLSHFSEMEQVWNSEAFDVGGYEWKVDLYPKGNGKAVGRYISIYLECVEASNFAPHQKVKLDALIRIKNKLNDANHHKKVLHAWITSSTTDWGYAEFIAIADMSSKGFLVDDCCFLEIEISVQAVVLDAPKI